MRYLVGLVSVLAGLGTLPQSVSAQAGEEGTPTEPSAQEPAPSSEPAPEEPALQLKLDEAGVEVVPGPKSGLDWSLVGGDPSRVKRAAIGLGVSAGVLFVGGVFVVVGLKEATSHLEGHAAEWTEAFIWTGTALTAGGLAGMIASGVLLGKRKRDRDRLREAHYGTPRRVQWDLARSRLVF